VITFDKNGYPFLFIVVFPPSAVKPRWVGGLKLDGKTTFNLEE
jgi:hypothetical protein